MIDPLDIAWCAGFIDGEGSMFVTLSANGKAASSHAWGIVTRVDQVVEEPARKLESTLGGRVGLRSFPTSTGKPVWRWTVLGARQHRILLPLLMPHLTVKRAKAELMLIFCETVGGTGTRITPDTLLLRNEIRQLIKEA